MVPKFRGGSDDWLDDEDSMRKRSSGVKTSKPITARSLGLPLEQANAVVAEVFPNQCRVRMDESKVELLCSYRRAGVVNQSKAEARERTPVAVGDRVLVTLTGASSGVIDGICERLNCISRPAPGRDAEKFQHVLAANIDLLVIVASCREPEFSEGLVDRFLVAAEAEGISSCLCITKIDLEIGLNEKVQKSQESRWQVYRDLNYPIYEVSPKKQFGISLLEKEILGKSVVFCGQSGVGKTSLLRSLIGSDIGRVGEVSASTGKGRHTTTGAVLLGGPKESKWIDTPGIREFGLTKIMPNQLAECFPEFRELTCKQKTCLHLDEEGCNASRLIRYASYRRILTSLLSGEN